MDSTSNLTDMDTFGAGTGTSELPNSSSPATPATNKRIRPAASDDDIQSKLSSGAKRTRLDNVNINSSDGSAPLKEKSHSSLWGMLVVVNLKLLTMKMLCRLFCFMQCMSMRAALSALVPIQIWLTRANGPRSAGKKHVVSQWRIMV